MRRAIILALILGACTSVDVDNRPAGTGDHSVIVANHESGITDYEARARRMEQQQDQAAAAKCGTMKVQVLRRVQATVKDSMMTFRCIKPV
jgi:hypothetical protein